MQRSPYKAIDRYYNQGTQYNVPMPIFRRSVMPGQTANLDGVCSFRTAALPVTLSKLVVTPAISSFPTAFSGKAGLTGSPTGLAPSQLVPHLRRFLITKRSTAL